MQKIALKGKLSPYAKSLIAWDQIGRGEAFLASAYLLKQSPRGSEESFQSVHLHLMAQSLELLLKGSLMLSDSKKYNEAFLKDRFGHDLAKLADEVVKISNQNQMTEKLGNELKGVNNWFKGHRLRYSGIHTIFINPCSIETANIEQRLYSLLRLLRRLKRSGLT